MLRIGEREVGPGRSCFVIAEAGVYHDGQVARAHELIDAAAAARADAVKFQTFRADDLATTSAPRAEYQKKNLGSDGTQVEMLRKLELPSSAWAELRDHARERGLVFLSTPFDHRSLALLLDLGVPAVKIGSGDLTNLPLVRAAAASGRAVLCSTGMATLGEVASAVDAVRSQSGEIALLHCVSAYPAATEDANLRAMPLLAEVFGVVVGYSDHTLGPLAALAAVALGASILEKHLTLDRDLPGPDHRASLEPDAFGALVRDLRLVESALGTGDKAPQASERDTMAVARRSLTYGRDRRAGEVVEAKDVDLRRPAGGLPAALGPAIVGRRLRRDVAAGTHIALDDLE